MKSLPFPFQLPSLRGLINFSKVDRNRFRSGYTRVKRKRRGKKRDDPRLIFHRQKLSTYRYLIELKIIFQ